jgi:hypothetical protein
MPLFTLVQMVDPKLNGFQIPISHRESHPYDSDHFVGKKWTVDQPSLMVRRSRSAISRSAPPQCQIFLSFASVVFMIYLLPGFLPRPYRKYFG